MSFRVSIETIPHHLQDYETVGNWKEYPNGELSIEVSAMDNWRYEALVAVHELIEQILCKSRGIKEADVTAFDMGFEQDRDPGDESEPGDDPKAPYRREHFFATNVERLLAAELGVDWEDYDSTVVGLSK